MYNIWISKSDAPIRLSISLKLARRHEARPGVSVLSIVSWPKQYQLVQEIRARRMVCGLRIALNRFESDMDYHHESTETG